MKPSTKAALISALLFPGLGQLIVLKSTRRAAIFALPAAVALISLLGSVIATADAIAKQILEGTLPLDVESIARQIGATGPSLLGNIASGVLIVAWLGSVIDALLRR